MATILFFFDDPSEHQVVERLLRRAGHDVVGTDDIAYAAEVLTAFPVDLMLLDVDSAGGASLRLLEAVRSDPELDDLPAVVCAPAHDSDVLQLTRELRAGALVFKHRGYQQDLLDQISRHGSSPFFVPGLDESVFNWTA
jgi:CheY-like chemotaxis protein